MPRTALRKLRDAIAGTLRLRESGTAQVSFERRTQQAALFPNRDAEGMNTVWVKAVL